MSIFYIDSSVILGILFQEPTAKKYRPYFNSQKKFYSSALLEAEVYSAATREKVELSQAEEILGHVALIFPERSLQSEYLEIFSKGYCRGADAHHLACALYLEPEKKAIKFLSTDGRQKEMAKRVGLRTI